MIISAALSGAGAPARLLEAWSRGAFELIVSEMLLAELERALGYPKLLKLIPAEAAAALIELLRSEAELCTDPPEPPPIGSEDSGDDYLIALSAAEGAALVSGDQHLLALATQLPVLTPRGFLDHLPDAFAAPPGS
jgi:putative PIN family toxin of toxin-antitoxin system